ncbi:MAG: phosphomannomutase/phosphoglucomutase [Candidatus Woesearchaeota archaeon]|jgi:phosphomannomutase|nr:phosphomannomutase/phosphoglucomutase [Candidatus Woesearchaeota archaeon]MDP7506663.1 phosphomannomutase/phosphoglucomutase [Candidatus Woesearchaeota archaeon]MDP7610613.1 phosphomannomutase/phosphoglucomutase [Candidatus Woesearchaeota archaeon]|tara:strand:+ start:2360 stop:3715 length:1356 start_codon:yes stop_codon:yes gene_type:complete
MEIFKAYDIRGVYPDDLDEDKAYKIGRAFIKLLKKEDSNKSKLTVVVSRDMRLSSPSLSKEVIKGITDEGADVVDIGLSSTPTFYYAVAKYGYDGGLQVSASHNPKEYNGIKVVRAKAFPVGLENGLDKIKEICLKDNFSEPKEKGNVSKKEDVLPELVQYSLKFYDFPIKPLKVVADTANSMGALDIEELFKNIPCELVKMNFELDGTFPAHQADPFQEKNVKDLKKKVVEEEADLGIATDGDGDRIFFVDDKGTLIEPAIIRGIISRVVLGHHPNSKICYDIRPGMITKDMIVENGGTPIVTKVGHSLIKKKAIEEGAEFAGESSGHFFVKTEYGFFETPLIIALIIMDEISKNGSISKIVKPLRKYFHSGEINSKVDNKEGIMEKLKEKYSDGKVSTLDGVSVEYDDWWFNVRPSNTESLLRLNLEARTKKRMEEKKKEVLEIIKSNG